MLVGRNEVTIIWSSTTKHSYVVSSDSILGSSNFANPSLRGVFFLKRQDFHTALLGLFFFRIGTLWTRPGRGIVDW